MSMTANLAVGGSSARRPNVNMPIKAAASIWPVLPIVVLVYSFLLLAPEVRFTVAGITLPPYRLVLIPLFLQVFVSLVMGRLRLNWADLLVIAASGSTLVSFMSHYGNSEGVVRAFGTIIDSAGAYFVARSSIRKPNDLRIALIMLAPGLLLAGLEMAFESFSKRLIIRPLFQKYFGSSYIYLDGQEVGALQLRQDFRMGGLLRAYGTFSHPILGGLVLSSSLLMFFYSSIRGIPKKIGIFASFLGFFALSSATIISLALSAAVIGLNELVKRVRNVTWWLVTGALIFVGAFIEIGSKGGLVNVLIRQTLDPQTGYFRKLIWEYGLISIGKHPWLGIGYEEYERPPAMHSSSVDAHFLALGIRDGVFVPLAILAAFIITQVALGRAIGRISGPDRKLLLGVNGSLFGLLVASMTVTFFSEGMIWFMALIGIGSSLGQLVPDARPVSALKPSQLHRPTSAALQNAEGVR